MVEDELAGGHHRAAEALADRLLPHARVGRPPATHPPAAGPCRRRRGLRRDTAASRRRPAQPRDGREARRSRTSRRAESAGACVCGQYSGARLATCRPAGSHCGACHHAAACVVTLAAALAVLLLCAWPPFTRRTGRSSAGPTGQGHAEARGAAAAVERDAEHQVEGAGGRRGLVVARRRAGPRVADDVGRDARGGARARRLVAARAGLRRRDRQARGGRRGVPPDATCVR